jgi:perosamine synthetase
MSASKDLPQRVTQAIQAAIGPGPAMLHEPSFQGNEWLYLQQCLESTYVSSVGKFVDQFEAELARYTGAKHAVAVVNGTAALHISLLLAGVTPGDEVLVPTLTFAATANAVAYCNATPHFVDSDEQTMGIDPRKLRGYLSQISERNSGFCVNKATGRPIRAMVPMHTFGHPSDLDSLMAIANDFDLIMIEDAAESLGSKYNGQHTGTFGLMGTLSFNGNKTITTGGGGAILTNNDKLARQAKHLTTTAKLAHRWEYRHDSVAFNYRLPNLNAALGCAQLEQLPALLEAKRLLFERYRVAFSSVRGVSLFREPAGSRSNYWLHTLMLDINVLDQLDPILLATNEANLMTRPAWTLMHELAHFNSCPRMDLTSSQLLSRRIINIPSSPRLL